MTVGTAGAQGGDVRDGRRVLPHLRVHRGREHHGTARGQQGRGEQIVGAAVRGSRHQVGGRRGDDDEIGVLAEAHMRHLRDVGEDTRVHGVAGQRLERRVPTNSSADSVGITRTWWPASVNLRMTSTPCRRRSRRRRRRRCAGAEPAVIRVPVAGSAGAAHSPSVCSSRSEWISRSAIESGFSCRPGSTSGPDVLEDPVAELVVVVVDLPGALGRVDHQRVLRRGAFEQLVDGRVGDAERGVVGAPWRELRRYAGVLLTRSLLK